MPKSENLLQNRDAKRDIGTEVLESLRAIKAGTVGAVHKVPESMAAEARQQLGPSKAQIRARRVTTRR